MGLSHLGVAGRNRITGNDDVCVGDVGCGMLLENKDASRGELTCLGRIV